MLKKLKVLILFIIMILGTSILLSGCGGSSGNGTSQANEVVYTMTAQNLATEYTNNRAVADTKYKNKTVKISGTVKYKGQFNNSTDIYISLYNIYEPVPVNVLVGFNINQKNAVNNVKEGDIVEIKGTVIGVVPQTDKSKISIQVDNSVLLN